MAQEIIMKYDSAIVKKIWDSHIDKGIPIEVLRKEYHISRDTLAKYIIRFLEERKVKKYKFKNTNKND